MTPEDKRKYYDSFFKNDKEKAEAFDKIAELYYFQNFGMTAKSDIDVLMFSIYLERILESSESDMSAYSDYALSKQLGITQSKIKNLKIKKELKYPYQGFDWRESFKRIYSNAHYENGCIVLYVSDPNLQIELKHFVEENNGIVEVKLNQSLLVISLESFFDLILFVADEKEQKYVKEKLKNALLSKKANIESFEKQPMSKTIKENAKDLGKNLVFELLKNLPIVGSVAPLIQKTVELIEET